MKPTVVYAAALAVGLVGGAAGMGSYNVFVVGLPPADSTAPDSAAVEELVEAGDSTTDSVAGLEGTQVTGPEGDSVQVAEGDPEGGSDQPVETQPLPDPEPVVEVPVPDADSIARAQVNYQRLARIFAAMRPDEAAPVLAQLDNEQLEGILMSMQGRNAAPILAAMDPERVAEISRTVLRGNR